MKEKLKDMLYPYNVSPRYVGFHYFMRAVELAAEDPDRLQHLRIDIYQIIASEYQTNVPSVVKNLRTIRDVFIRNNGAVLLEQIGGGTYWYHNLPSPGDMISIFSYYCYCGKMDLNS